MQEVLFTLASCCDGDIRLAEGTYYQGRVQVCANGEWGTVENSDEQIRETNNVICRQLGLIIGNYFFYVDEQYYFFIPCILNRFTYAYCMRKLS